MRKHLSDAEATLTTNISMASRRFLQEHGGDTSSFKCMGIAKVVQPQRGGDHHRTIWCCESFWVFELDSRVPRGLNKCYCSTPQIMHYSRMQVYSFQMYVWFCNAIVLMFYTCFICNLYKLTVSCRVWCYVTLSRGVAEALHKAS